MKKVIIAVVLIVALGAVGVLAGALLTAEQYAEFSPLQEREYKDSQPDAIEAEYIKITARDTGNDIFVPAKNESYVYRYGPSMIRNADGSIDAYFSAPGVFDEWDWILYRHSPDGGKTWTEEKSVLAPTPASKDFYSCCDPAVVKAGGYYYLAYTSTVDEGGVDNNVFVARSESLEGPFYKWNGNGWGGSPEPIIEYTGDPATYGAGEPSLVVVGDKLYVYYTWRDGELNHTRLSIARAEDENWPATLEYVGVAIDHKVGDTDSADVKYVDDYGKFIAVSTATRFTTDSYIKVYVSDDGLTFGESYALKTNTSHCLHNCGITSREDGHIRLVDEVYIAYAYGEDFGTWATRINQVDIQAIDEPDFSDLKNENYKNTFKPVHRGLNKSYVGITTDPHTYEKSISAGSFEVEVYKIDRWKYDKRITDDVTLTDFDSTIISVDGAKVIPKAVGETYVTASWNGHRVVFLVKITE